MQQMLQQLLAMQEKEAANMKADLVRRKAGRKKILAEMKVIRAETKAMRYKRMEIRRDDRKKTTACQYEMEANIKKMEPNPEQKETVVEQHEIPNEEVAIHSLRTCRSETAASQEATETERDPGKTPQ
jgi:hypothetical protein